MQHNFVHKSILNDCKIENEIQRATNRVDLSLVGVHVPDELVTNFLQGVYLLLSTRLVHPLLHAHAFPFLLFLGARNRNHCVH